MDNTNNLSQSVLQSSEAAIPSTGSTSNDSSFFDSLKSINATTWILIILILAFLGFNIFVYLAKGTQEITNIFAPLVEKIFGTTVAITDKTLNVSAEGAKAVVSGTAGVLDAGLTSIQNVTTPNSNLKGQPVNQQQQQQQPDIMQQSSLNRALNTSQSQQQQQYDYQANEATSSVHGGQSGWCYIGEDRGYRTCAQVGANDTCMSGDIFPSQEICVNPNLRA